MIRKSTIVIAFIVVALTSMSCHRQKLEEILYTKSLIPVLLDWETRAVLDVNNDPDGDLYSASVWLFPTGESLYQGSPLEYKMSNAIYDYIDVPVGVYDVLIFNKTVGEYSSNVGFRGTESFETFEYYTNPYLTKNATTSSVDDLELRLEPDLLAAWRSSPDEPLVVTQEMIEQMTDIIVCREYLDTKYFSNRSSSSLVISQAITRSDFDALSEDMKQLVGLQPERLTHIITVEESVENIHSASAAVGTMWGMSSSVKLADAEYSTTQTAHNFLFENKYITSEDSKDGYMDAEFRVIGPLHHDAAPTYKLYTLFTLIDTYDSSSYYPTPPNDSYLFGVTDQVYDGEAVMGLDKLIPIYVGTEGEVITLPDLAIGGEGFNADVNDWDDEIDVPL